MTTNMLGERMNHTRQIQPPIDQYEIREEILLIQVGIYHSADVIEKW
jgi:hypothetical protein